MPGIKHVLRPAKPDPSDGHDALKSLPRNQTLVCPSSGFSSVVIAFFARVQTQTRQVCGEIDQRTTYV
jgi:hypothetical protein